MKAKGNLKKPYRPTPLEEAVKKLLDDPGQWAGELDGPSPEDMAVRFQERLREESAGSPRVSDKTAPRTSRTAVLRVLKAAAVLAVFTAGYLAGNNETPGRIIVPKAAATQEPAPPVRKDVTDGTILVRLVLEAPEARSVTVAADWNQWKPETQPLSDEDGDGIWEIHLRLQRGKDYQYQFVIDGSRWVADPGARVQIDDGFGGVNSLLNI